MTPLIQFISSEEVRTVRHPVLRTNKPYESCFFAEDSLSSTFHIGIYTTMLIGVVTFIQANTPLENDTLQYQLRGMAVLPDFQHKGFGAQLINHGIKHIQKLGGKIIWCNSREIAKEFYNKQGFEVIGSPFDIPKIGKHYCMRKKL